MNEINTEKNKSDVKATEDSMVAKLSAVGVAPIRIGTNMVRAIIKAAREISEDIKNK